ncbi:MAG: type II toxin-antitoxin system Phd/YefM family antitoxin [Limisphaerales bacterium]
MSAISETTARENLAQTMDRVCDDREPMIITRQKRRSVVMLSLKDYESLSETAYLFQSRVNARDCSPRRNSWNPAKENPAR